MHVIGMIVASTIISLGRTFLQLPRSGTADLCSSSSQQVNSKEPLSVPLSLHSSLPPSDLRLPPYPPSTNEHIRHLPCHVRRLVLSQPCRTQREPALSNRHINCSNKDIFMSAISTRYTSKCNHYGHTHVRTQHSTTAGQAGVLS